MHTLCTHNNCTYHFGKQQCTYMLIADFINKMSLLPALYRPLPIPTPILILISECGENCAQTLLKKCPDFNVAPTLTASTKQPCTNIVY